MSATTINTGSINEDAGMLVSMLDPYPPFKKAGGEYCKHLVVNTDFSSGDDVVISFAGATDIRSVNATGATGTNIAFAIADIGGGVTGKKVTFASQTADLYVDIHYSI